MGGQQSRPHDAGGFTLDSLAFVVMIRRLLGWSQWPLRAVGVGRERRRLFFLPAIGQITDKERRNSLGFVRISQVVALIRATRHHVPRTSNAIADVARMTIVCAVFC